MGRTRTGGPGRGFTLIELLVVMAVIALLMAVLLPVLGRVRKQAQAVVCQAKLRQWGTGFSAYAGDHDASLLQPPQCRHQHALSGLVGAEGGP